MDRLHAMRAEFRIRKVLKVILKVECDDVISLGVNSGG